MPSAYELRQTRHGRRLLKSLARHLGRMGRAGRRPNSRVGMGDSYIDPATSGPDWSSEWTPNPVDWPGLAGPGARVTLEAPPATAEPKE